MTDVAAFVAGALVFGFGVVVGMCIVLAFNGRVNDSDGDD